MVTDSMGARLGQVRLTLRRREAQLSLAELQHELQRLAGLQDGHDTQPVQAFVMTVKTW